MKSSGWTVLAVAIGLGLGIFWSVKPWKEFNHQRIRRDEALAKMKVAESQRADLMKTHAKLNTSLGMEELARNAKYHKTDERPIEVGE